MIEHNKDTKRLYGLISKINSDDIKLYTLDALNKADDEFWTAPASSTGKYHPPEDLGESGLVRHVIKAVYVAEEFFRFYDNFLEQKDKDIVISAVLLHDIKKNGLIWGNRTDYTHGLIAYKWLDQFKLDDADAKREIRNCVRYHMGRWVQPADSELESAISPSINEHIVQVSDYVSSRKGISFMPK